MQVTIELRALDWAHCAEARRWRNDYRIWRHCRQNDLISDVDQERWFERQASDPSIKMYAVVVIANAVATHVGVCGLTSIDWQNRRAEFSLYIGPEFQGAGHGRRALKNLLAHAFTNLGLHQIWGEVFDGNVPALKTFGALGFMVDGRLRQRYWRDGRFLDTYMVSLLADEWRAQNGSPVAGADGRDAPSGPSPAPEAAHAGEPSGPRTLHAVQDPGAAPAAAATEATDPAR